MNNNFISLSEAREYTKKFRDNLPNMLTENFQDALSYCETFDAEAVRAILNQDGCLSFRVYNGLNNNNEVCSILVGVDENFEDILNGENSLLVNRGKKCPTFCPVNIL